ncbi:CxC ATPase DNA modification system associated small protein [Streptomyces roseochromogenus]|uniref:CxC ATPase DNA modification system associated small protein n=1 Tax=Streptomyces roseochromogenus TaxID=285450 RepID=UPI0009974B04|nr:CxC ATPase DNA modification system associated small protein [Streptomyces roseochromogenus]
MSLDLKISHAIREAVANSEQEPALAHRLITWMEAVTSGSEDLHDSSDTDRRLELLFSSTEVDDVNRDGGGIF